MGVPYDSIRSAMDNYEKERYFNIPVEGTVRNR